MNITCVMNGGGKGAWKRHITPSHFYSPPTNLLTPHPPTSALGLYLPPPTYSAYTYSPTPTSDYPQISIDFLIMCFFSYFDCFRNLKKNLFDGSLSCFSARLFRLRDFHRSSMQTILEQNPPEVTVKTTWRAFHILWIVHKYLWTDPYILISIEYRSM